MSWAGLASNQMVSYTDAQTSGFNLQSGQSQVTSNQCMTKNDALTKYVLNSSYMSSYASNQLVPKSAWVSGVVGNAFTFGPNVSSTASGSCSLSTTGYTVYSSDTVLGSNSQLFENAAMTLPAFQNGVVYGNPYVNSSYGPMRLTVNSEYCYISSYIGACSGVTSFAFGTVDSLNSSGACSGANTGRTLYSNSSTLSVNTQLYVDQYLMFKFIPGDGTQSFYLHSGSNSYRVTPSGIIDLITACITATSFQRDSQEYNTGIQCCNNGITDSYWYSTDTTLVVGSLVFEDAGLSTPFDGMNLWYYTDNGGNDFRAIRVSATGQVTQSQIC